MTPAASHRVIVVPAFILARFTMRELADTLPPEWLTFRHWVDDFWGRNAMKENYIYIERRAADSERWRRVLELDKELEQLPKGEQTKAAKIRRAQVPLAERLKERWHEAMRVFRWLRLRHEGDRVPRWALFGQQSEARVHVRASVL